MSRSISRFTVPLDRFHHVTLAGAPAADGHWDRGALTLQFPRTRGAQAQWRAQVPEIKGWPAVDLFLRGQVRSGHLPATSVMARLIWKDAAGEPLARETQDYIPHNSLYGPPSQRTPFPEGRGDFVFRNSRAVPRGACSVELIIAVIQAPGVVVSFRDVRLTQVARPRPRPVCLGTSCWWPATVNPRDPVRSATQNTAGFVGQIAKAKKLGVDLLVLPEATTLVGVPNNNYHTIAEAPDGPTTRALAAAARKNHIYVVGCHNLQVGSRVTNTATLFGPTGKILGRYEKVHVPNEEVDGAVTEGNAYPVFETPLGVIGMMICWDVVFPECARALALGGAELLALPIWGGSELLMQARALENNVYLVSSGFDARNTIIDPLGNFLANQKAVKGPERTAKILHATVDLARPQRWDWVGDFTHRWMLERRPLD